MNDIKEILIKKKIKEFEISDSNELSYFNIVKAMTEDIVNKENKITKNKNMVKKFVFLFEDIKEVNGCTFCEQNLDFLVLTYGAITQVFEYFFNLLKYPGFLSNLGKVDKYKDLSDIDKSGMPNDMIEFMNSIEKSNKNIFIYERICMSNNENLILPEINDSLRKDLALFLSLEAIYFLIMHEIGHIMNGHIYMLKENLNMSEIKIHNNHKMNPLDYVTLEMDADAFATTQSIKHLIDLYKNPTVYSYPQKDDLLKYWYFAISSLFAFLPSDISPFDIKEGKNLPNKIRLALCFDIAMLLAKQNNISNSETDIDILMDREANRLYNMLFNKPNYDKKVQELIKGKERIIYSLTDIYKRWNKLRPLLKPYARVELAPYNKYHNSN